MDGGAAALAVAVVGQEAVARIVDDACAGVGARGAGVESPRSKQSVGADFCEEERLQRVLVDAWREVGAGVDIVPAVELGFEDELTPAGTADEGVETKAAIQ